MSTETRNVPDALLALAWVLVAVGIYGVAAGVVEAASLARAGATWSQVPMTGIGIGVFAVLGLSGWGLTKLRPWPLSLLAIPWFVIAVSGFLFYGIRPFGLFFGYGFGVKTLVCSGVLLFVGWVLGKALWGYHRGTRALEDNAVIRDGTRLRIEPLDSSASFSRGLLATAAALVVLRGMFALSAGLLHPASGFSEYGLELVLIWSGGALLARDPRAYWMSLGVVSLDALNTLAHGADRLIVTLLPEYAEAVELLPTLGTALLGLPEGWASLGFQVGELLLALLTIRILLLPSVREAFPTAISVRQSSGIEQRPRVETSSAT